jgi:hypothetical protein
MCEAHSAPENQKPPKTASTDTRADLTDIFRMCHHALLEHHKIDNMDRQYRIPVPDIPDTIAFRFFHNRRMWEEKEGQFRSTPDAGNDTTKVHCSRQLEDNTLP